MKVDQYYHWRIITIVFAMMLQILPLPLWAHIFWPQWVLLTLIAWLMVSPQSLSMPLVFLLGLFMDLLLGTPFGLHALSFTVCAYITVRIHRQIQHFPLWQQALLIGFCLLLGALIVFIGLSLFSDAPSAFNLLTALTGMLLWPWIAHIFNISWRDHTPRYA